MKEFNIALACISFLILALGMIYKKVKRSVFSEPILAMAMGVLLGPDLLNVLKAVSIHSSLELLELACEMTISIALMATAYRIPLPYILNHKKLLTILLLAGMAGMCAFSAWLLKMVFNFDWLICFLIGAIITPTDPVISSTIVSGETAIRLMPERIRHAISFESGANDGLAFPLVFLPLLLLIKPTNAWKEWLLQSVLWETGGGIVLGLLIGYSFGWLFLKAKKAEWIGETALLIFSLALSTFTLGTLELMDCNGIIGVFAAGLAADYVLDKEERSQQEDVQEALERIFTIPVFVLFGLVLPWHDWIELGWKAVLIVVLILALRRLPVIMALRPLLRKLPHLADLAMIGWFGPIGVAALYYAILTLNQTGNHQVWVITSLMVFGSTLIHGVSGYPLGKLYSKHYYRKEHLV